MKLRHIFNNKHLLKVCAVLIGYSAWSYLSARTMVYQEYAMPVYFYNDDVHEVHCVPEVINVVLKGPRQAMRSMSHDDCGIFINRQECNEHNAITLKRHHLFLPTSVKVVSFSSQAITIF